MLVIPFLNANTKRFHFDVFQFFSVESCESEVLPDHSERTFRLYCSLYLHFDSGCASRFSDCRPLFPVSDLFHPYQIPVCQGISILSFLQAAAVVLYCQMVLVKHIEHVIAIYNLSGRLMIYLPFIVNFDFIIA